VGFFGDFVLARSDAPLLDASVFGSGFACAEGHPDCVHVWQPREGGWQIVQVHHGVPDISDGRWLSGLVAATGSPVMIASVMDSDVCEVRGLTPSGSSWSACLDPAMAAEFGLPTPDVAGSVEQLVAWAAEAQCTADRRGLSDVLTRRADVFVEDLFFELIDACGLPAPTLAEDTPVSGDHVQTSEVVGGSPLVHPDHRLSAHCPSGMALELSILNLGRDGTLVLECAADSDCYAQVWLRPDGSYQLEYRDRGPGEHFQTRTVSVEKVIAALRGWSVGAIDWRDRFDWIPFVS
jgi:hypothetical protein